MLSMMSAIMEIFPRIFLKYIIFKKNLFPKHKGELNYHENLKENKISKNRYAGKR